MTHEGGVPRFAYNPEGKLTTREGYAYSYDGDGKRVMELNPGGKTTIWVGNYYEQSNQQSSNTFNETIYADGVRIGMRKNNQTNYWFHLDHLGGTHVITMSEGQFNSRDLYKAWGEQRYSQGNTDTRYRYTGQMKEDDNLYYYGARWYDPDIGRFMQADTIIPMASQGTQAFDRYAYVNNNPILYRDENGHWVSTLVGGIIGAAVGYGVQVYQNIQSGLTVTDALTTNISAEKILAGAAAGAIAGTFLPLAASAISTTGLFTTGTAAGTTMCADGDCANEATTVYNALKMQSVRETGSLGELASGITRTYERIYSVTRTAMYRVPDRLDHNLRVLTEVKNVATLHLTNQIRDFALYKSPEGYCYSLDIITRVTTNITPTMQRFIDEYGINIIRLIE